MKNPKGNRDNMIFTVQFTVSWRWVHIDLVLCVCFFVLNHKTSLQKEKKKEKEKELGQHPARISSHFDRINLGQNALDMYHYFPKHASPCLNSAE